MFENEINKYEQDVKDAEQFAKAKVISARWFILAFLVVAILFFVVGRASAQNTNITKNTFNTQTTATSTEAFAVGNIAPSLHTVEVTIVGNPANCTVQPLGAQRSTDTYYAISSAYDCTAGGANVRMFHVAGKVVNFVKVQMTAFDGTSWTAVYTGAR